MAVADRKIRLGAFIPGDRAKRGQAN
jgi:hypothetical protein